MSPFVIMQFLISDIGKGNRFSSPENDASTSETSLNNYPTGLVVYYLNLSDYVIMHHAPNDDGNELRWNVVL